MKRISLFQCLLILAVLFPIISCGGGGGGGGGAAGPAATSDTPSENEPVASAPVKSSAAEIISFKFEKTENDPELSALSNDLEGSSSDGQNIIVTYNYGTLDDQPLLKPTIVVSPKATVLEDTNQKFNFFDSANPVHFTVKAEDGTEKVWTVAMQENAPGEHNIYYRPEGITHPYPATYNESTGIQFDENPNKVIAKNYYFDGWFEDESCSGSAVTGWGRMEKTGDVTLYAKLQPAPYADLANSKVFANGIPVTVKENAGATMVFFTDASGSEKSLKSINENYDTNFAGFDLYAGTSGEADAPTSLTSGFAAYLSAPAGNITIEGGRLNNVYGGSGNAPEAALACGSNVYLSGNPEIGNQKKSGIWLKSFSGNKVNVNALVNATKDNKITLIAAPDMPTGAVVVEATGHYTLKEHYTLRNSYRTENVELENGGNNIVLKASISLPDPEDVKWSRDSDGDYFTLGPDHFHSDGTILSIGVEGGFFKVPSTTVTGGNFDMAIRYSDDSLNEYLDNRYIDGGSSGDGLKTSDKLKYVQFKSASGDIAASAASSFLEKVKFFIEPGKSSVKIKLNLQTVPLQTIIDAGVTYFNGSFYKIVQQNGISWDNALAKAKESKFNNLEGYLMTITSQTENMFIYDRVYAKADPKINQSNARGWIGAQRGGDGIWRWVCGPEAGTEFYSQSARQPLNGNFSSWDSWEDRTRNRIWTTYPASAFVGGVIPKYDKENNAIKPIAQSHRNDDVYWPEFIKGVQEKDNKWYVDWKHPHADKGDCAYYTGTYVWGNENGSKGYIIEYTAYDAEGANNPHAPVLIAEKDYSHP
ncbi:MAG: InlB B-repeat-containing protein [Spirochaetaceae bacterium]|nr:InlB B-repeat-containing protein [Spirochaetaceae bacterium]